MQIVLDKNIKSLEDRKRSVQEQLDRLYDEGRVPSHYIQDRIATYLIEATDLEPRGEILTPNRMVTINKRETSHEGLVDKLEGGESAFHSLIKEDKNTVLTPKVEITEDDIREVPGLAELRQAIAETEARIPSLEGKERGYAKKQLIEMRQDQYVLKNAHRQPIYAKGSNNIEKYEGKINFGLQEPKTVSSILLVYAGLWTEYKDNLNSDVKWMLEDLNRLIEKALSDKPTLMYILHKKILGYDNETIKKGLQDTFGVNHTEEYISSLYRNKIPKAIADAATEEWIDYMFMNNLKGEYKKCSRCQKIKLANNRNFSINKTSSSKFYSICKECRNSKK